MVEYGVMLAGKGAWIREVPRKGRYQEKVGP
jgi:hypothetical protein